MSNKHHGNRQPACEPGKPAPEPRPLEPASKLAGLAVMITTLSRELAVKLPCEVAVNGKPLAANLWAVTTDGKIGIGADAGARPGDVVRVCFRGISPTFFVVREAGGTDEIPRAEAEAISRGWLRDLARMAAARIMKVCYGTDLVTAEQQTESILHDFAREILSASGGGR